LRSDKDHAVSIANIEAFQAVKHLPEKPDSSSSTLIPLVGASSFLPTNGEIRRRKLLHGPFLSISSIYLNLEPRLNEQITTEVLPLFEDATMTTQPSKMIKVSVGYTSEAALPYSHHPEPSTRIFRCHSEIKAVIECQA
jgi:hypothetical protein